MTPEELWNSFHVDCKGWLWVDNSWGMNTLYFLCDGDEIVYVGVSSRAVARIVEHSIGATSTPAKAFTRALCVVRPGLSRKQVEAEEATWIRQLRPKYNIQNNAAHYRGGSRGKS